MAISTAKRVVYCMGSLCRGVVPAVFVPSGVSSTLSVVALPAWVPRSEKSIKTERFLLCRPAWLFEPYLGLARPRLNLDSDFVSSTI